MSVKKGNIPWNKGIKYTKKMKRNLTFQKGNTFGRANKGRIKGPRPLKLRLQHSVYMKAHPQSPWLGKKMSKETREKMSLARKGYKHTLETKVKISLSKKGNKNYNWKGGTTKKYKLAWRTPKFKEWRKSVFERDNYTCRGCEIKGARLEAHHILSFTKFPSKGYDIDNGLTLCVVCHNKTKKGRYV